MSPQPKRLPQPDLPPGPGNLYDVGLLAQRLGLTPGTLRQYVVHRAPWLPEPMRLGGKLVWTAESLRGIDEAHPRKAGWAGRREREAREAAAATEQAESPGQ